MAEKVSLRSVEQDDVGLFFAHMQDEQSQYMAAFVARDPADRAAHDAHWAKIMADQDVLIRTIVFDGNLAGHVAKFVMFGDNEITYWVDRAYWGQGIATKALQLFLELYKDRPLHARAARDNQGSIRVLEKCGFVHTGYDKGFANARGQEIEEAIMVLTG
jgi:RimJ/RimL family protein N-acetyltransferase